MYQRGEIEEKKNEKERDKKRERDNGSTLTMEESPTEISMRVCPSARNIRNS